MKRYTVFLKVLLTAFLITWLISKLNWRVTLKELQNVNFKWLLPLMLLGPTSMLFLSIRWKEILLKYKIDIPILQATQIISGGQFFNTFMPGSTGGDVLKFVTMRRLLQNQESEIFASIILDRLFGIIALLLLATIGIIVEPKFLYKSYVLLKQSPIKTAIECVVLISVIAASTLIYFYRHKHPFVIKIKNTIKKTKDLFLTRLINTKVATTALSLSIAIHCISFMRFYCLSHSIGINISYASVSVVVPIVLIVTMIPVSINGHGVRELILISYFTLVGITGKPGLETSELAISVSFLFVLNDFVLALIGGLWFSRFKIASV